MKKHNARSIWTEFIILAVTALMFCWLFTGCTVKAVSALDENEILEYTETDEADETPEPETTEEGEAFDIIVLTPDADATPTPETDEDGEATPTPDADATPTPETEEDGEATPTPDSDATPTPTPSEDADATPTPEDADATPDPDATEDPEATLELTPTPTPEPSETPEVTPTPDPALDYVIQTFTNDPIEIEVSRGTSEDDLPLPTTLTAISGNSAEIEVPVAWMNETDGTEFDLNDYDAGSVYGYGPWTFTAVIDEATYTYEGEEVTASVSIKDCTRISSICGISSDGLLMRFVVFQGHSVRLPSAVGAYMSDGGYKNVPVSWNGSYDKNTVGTYTYTMSVDGDYSGGGSATAEIVVIKDND